MDIGFVIKSILNKIHIIQLYHIFIIYRIPYCRYLHKKRVTEIRKRGYVNVVFIVGNQSMWRTQGLYDLMKKDPRFHLYILMIGFKSYTKEENEKNILNMRTYFNERRMDCYTLDDLDPILLMNQWNPDLIFYPQPYKGIFPHNIDFTSFNDRLTAYIPYGLTCALVSWNYNSYLHNIAWRVYYPTEIHRANAKKLSDCKGANARVVGEPHADDFIFKTPNHVWKDNGTKKRIIWAPHFQINPNGMLYRPSFLWTYDIMIEIAKKYRDLIHFAFKPHPRLFSELCKHPDWGEKKANEYYGLWKSMPNTQFENGEYVDLFKESDALIHDCGSFVAEYMFVCKPCLFLTHDEQSVEQDLCDFGKKCFHLHNIGCNKENIIDFIDNIVIAGNDNNRINRKIFFNKYLTPPNGRTTSMNIFADIKDSIFGR